MNSNNIDSLSDEYVEKEGEYFSNPRLDVIRFIENESGLKILELGAGNGATLFELKKRNIASEIHLLDIIDKVDKKDVFDSVTILDIVTGDLSFEDNYFDCIICADVLEHIYEPHLVIDKLKRVLKNDGIFLVSLPNFRHFSAIKKVLFKRSFAYEDSGIFDRTHKRFYCKKDMIQLFDDHDDLQLESIKSNSWFLKWNRLINPITLTLFEDYLTLQYILKIRKHKQSNGE